MKKQEVKLTTAQESALKRLVEGELTESFIYASTARCLVEKGLATKTRRQDEGGTVNEYHHVYAITEAGRKAIGADCVQCKNCQGVVEDLAYTTCNACAASGPVDSTVQPEEPSDPDSTTEGATESSEPSSPYAPCVHCEGFGSHLFDPGHFGAGQKEEMEIHCSDCHGTGFQHEPEPQIKATPLGLVESLIDKIRGLRDRFLPALTQHRDLIRTPTRDKAARHRYQSSALARAVFGGVSKCVDDLRKTWGDVPWASWVKGIRELTPEDREYLFETAFSENEITSWHQWLSSQDQGTEREGTKESLDAVQS